MVACGQSCCEIEGCNRYSDVDVWYENGTAKSMCAEHGWAEDAVQFVPQHGGDDINQERS